MSVSNLQVYSRGREVFTEEESIQFNKRIEIFSLCIYTNKSLFSDTDIIRVYNLFNCNFSMRSQNYALFLMYLVEYKIWFQVQLWCRNQAFYNHIACQDELEDFLTTVC